MAHQCPNCYRRCHCRGDVDDISFGIKYDCNCPYSEWGCRSEIDDEEEEDYEDM